MLQFLLGSMLQTSPEQQTPLSTTPDFAPPPPFFPPGETVEAGTAT